MILGRNPALWLALITAALNALVIVFGVSLSGEQMAALNGLAIALIGVVANEADPTTVGTLAPTLTAPATSLSVAGSSSGETTPPATVSGAPTPPADTAVDAAAEPPPRPASWPPAL
jgi:uncharacterized membrane protein